MTGTEHNRTASDRLVSTILFSVLLMFILSGCSLGPRNLQGNRLDYNTTLQKSNNEELVLNLVRARYWEPPLFLQVGSVSASFGYSVD
ncbi:MAG: hypothetical protein PHU03_07890, partial [Syntrophales bacterium]|nr:hypothetical protein [Syntrophales bacterium]